ncbi:isopeptide-forming domain-containing fimbrial protein [Leucobacter chinensis]|uniref:isopeptide-forming domain-containing fimbrial protein n=1 Tax=Leucobacter chinensis TaxID=2851010 RepID=UPI001C217D7D|nr:isopeptide-forming domain-containing fimbrial protein [Leucobacter chinensis]
MHTDTGAITAPKKNAVRSAIAGASIAAIVAGTLVTAGVGAQRALADEPRPEVILTPQETHILGEDLTVDVTFSNPEGANATYNLSASLLLPATVELVSAETAPEASLNALTLIPTATYRAGDTLPGTPAAGDTCKSVGLDGPVSGHCIVPEGKQLAVFENFSDLPAKASISTNLRLRPLVDSNDTGEIAKGFAVGDNIELSMSLFASSNERYKPMFAGSSSVGGAKASAVTSPRSVAEASPKVNALRVTKSEPSPEHELLRGVHEQSTIYTLTVHHTAEGNLHDAVVVDYLPAGLEYLGSCDIADSTSDAGNGQGAAEYEGSGALATGAVGDNCFDEESIETIEASAAEAESLGLPGAGVYTKVTWNVGEWLATQQDTGVAPITQAASGGAGKAASTVIRYRAGVPLFENTLFTEEQAQALGAKGQGANLDNNLGASTRHGSPDADNRDAKKANTLRNTAIAEGTWNGVLPESALDERIEDSGSTSVKVVDVRVRKDVRVKGSDWGSEASFTQGSVVDYRLRVATSEYVGAELNDRPTRLVDDLENGLCPAYPRDITENISSAAVNGSEGQPNFLIGDPNTLEGRDYVDLETWNTKLAEAGLDGCQWGEQWFTDDATFSGAELSGIAFDPETGRFYQDLVFDKKNEQVLANPNAEASVVYSVRQNSAYLSKDGKNGATTSGDTVRNSVEIEALTTPRPEIAGLHNAGGSTVGDGFYVSDDSEARVRTADTIISKHVLNSDTVSASDITNANLEWVKRKETPVAVGDEVWYKIHWQSATGADVRNPQLTDFLPEGMAFDPAGLAKGNEWKASENLRVVPKKRDGSEITTAKLGPCTFDLTNDTNAAAAIELFNGKVVLDDEQDPRNLTWKFGSNDCYPAGQGPHESADRFWPAGVDLDIYLKVTVVQAQAFGDVDVVQNLAKYQQTNVDGQISFMRDDAEVTQDMSVRLIKGIERNDYSVETGKPVYPDAQTVNSNVDGQNVVQGSEVTYRLDVTAPAATTQDYEVWDLLPAGVSASDLSGYDAANHTVTGTGGLWSAAEGETPTAWKQGEEFTAHAYDWENIPADLQSQVSPGLADEKRSLVVWQVSAQVAGSTQAQGEKERTERGFTLGYTLVVPTEQTDAERAAQITQNYENVASVAQYSARNNGGGTTELVPTVSESAAQGKVQYGGNTVATSRPDQGEPVVKRTAQDGQYPVPADFATDPSHVVVPGVKTAKKLVSTEVKPHDSAVTDPSNTSGPSGTVSNRPDDAIVQGEHATFEYSVTIPANTTVKRSQLADDGTLTWSSSSSTPSSGSLEYEFVEGSAVFAGPTEGYDFVGKGFTLHETQQGDKRPGTLVFPESYTNNSGKPETFSVQVTLWVPDADASHADRKPNLGNKTTLTNTARYQFAQPNSDKITADSTTAKVTYLEPALKITKGANKSVNVSGSDTVKYTLTVANENGRVASYDNTVVDEVPEGLFIEKGSFAVNGQAIADSDLTFTKNVFDGEGGTITWSPETIEALKVVPESAKLTYSAKIAPETGAGQTFTNKATVRGFTLPETLDAGDPADTNAKDVRRGDRSAKNSATITATTAELSKQVRIASDEDSSFTNKVTAPVGETVEYRVDVALRPNISYYKPVITDTLPAGVTLVDAKVSGPEIASGGTVLGGEWQHTSKGQQHTWAYDGHIASSAEARTLRLTYQVHLGTGVTPAQKTLTNQAVFGWNVSKTGTERKQTGRGSADVAIVDPKLSLTKNVALASEGTWRDSVSAEVAETLQYRVVVQNSGTTPAYESVVTDTAHDGLVINAKSIRINGEKPADGEVQVDGQTITWKLHRAIAPGAENAVTLTYEGAFAPSNTLTSNEKHLSEKLKNEALVKRYESWPRDDKGKPAGREYTPNVNDKGVRDTAEAETRFPFVELSKTAVDDSRTAYVGEPFEWRITAKNVGAGNAQTVALSDALPENWAFGEVVSMTVGGEPVTPFAPEKGKDGSLIWSFGTALSETESGTQPAAILPGTTSGAGEGAREIVIRYTAVPQNPEATTKPGVGASKPHTNTVSAVTTDGHGQTATKSREHTGPEASDNAFLREADLLLEKQAIGGTTESIALVGDETIAEGSWVPGQRVGDGYEQPQWRVTVSNTGPDDSYGPFAITEKLTEPSGVTTGEWVATYYPSENDAEKGTNGSVLGRYHGEKFTVGDEQTMLDAEGEGRIVLVADVTVEPGAVASGTELSNTASVLGRTYEAPSNLPENAKNPNTATVHKELTPFADLTIAKTVNSAAAVAGSPVTWGLTVTNLGPSPSHASADAPITVSDTVPEGVVGVTASEVDGEWIATVKREGKPSEFPAKAGDVVTWTYQGAALPVGAASELTLSGTVKSSHIGAITNTATVKPGVTPEPKPNEPNEDSVTFEPGNETTIGITKTRVVKVAGVWQPASVQDEVAPITPGAEVSYRITVRTSGLADARGVQVVEESPAVLTYLRHEGVDGADWSRAAGGTNAAGVTDEGWDTFGLQDPATIVAGESESFVVTYQVAPHLANGQQVVNEAEASAENTDDKPRDRDNGSSNRAVDLSIAKTHTSPAAGEAAVAGSSVDYLLSITNHGPSVATSEVRVEDTLPAGLSLGQVQRITLNGQEVAVQQPEVVGQKLVWSDLTSGADLPVTGTIEIAYTANVASTMRAQTGVRNLATVIQDEDIDGSNNDADDLIDVVTSAEMAITKTVAEGPWVAGTEVEYTLSVENTGPSAAPARVVDQLPAGLTLISIDGADWQCDAVTQSATSGSCEYTANGGLVPVSTADAPIVSEITVVAAISESAAALPQPLTNEAVLTWHDSEGEKRDRDEAAIEVSRIADLGLEKEALKRVVSDDGTVTYEPNGTHVAGTTAWYRIVVANHGPSDATRPLVVNDQLSEGMSFVGLAPESVDTWKAEVSKDTPGHTVFTNEAETTLLNGQSVELVYEVRLAADAPTHDAEGSAIELTNTAALDTQKTLDPNGDPKTGREAPDGDEAVVAVARQIDLGIEKTHEAGAVKVGSPLAFIIDVVNHGPSQATGIVVTDTVPAGLDVLSEAGPVLTEQGENTGWIITGVTPDVDGSTVVSASYDAALNPGERATPLTIETLVTANAFPGVTNVAEVRATEPEPEDDSKHPNRAEDAVTVPPLVTLEVEKRAIGTFTVGEHASFEITVTNHGPTADPGPITVTDVLPEGLTYADASLEPVTVEGQSVTWSLEEGLATGESTSFTVGVTVGKKAYPSVTNVVTIDTPTEVTPDSKLDDSATAPVAQGDELPNTGASGQFGLLLVLAGLLLLGGAALLARSERRRRTA